MDTLVGKRSDAYQATEVYRERFGDDAIVVLVRGDLAEPRADRQPRPAARAGGLPVGQQAGGRGRRRAGRASPCAEFARTKPVKVVYGPGTFINSAVGEINDQFAAAARQQAAGGRAREPARRASSRARRGSAKAGQEQAAKRGRAARLRAVHARPADAQPALRARAQGAAAARRPRLRLRARVRPAARRDDAEGALRLPVPELALGGRSRCGSSPTSREAQRGAAIALVRERGGR